MKNMKNRFSKIRTASIMFVYMITILNTSFSCSNGFCLKIFPKLLASRHCSECCECCKYSVKMNKLKTSDETVLRAEIPEKTCCIAIHNTFFEIKESSVIPVVFVGEELISEIKVISKIIRITKNRNYLFCFYDPSSIKIIV